MRGPLDQPLMVVLLGIGGVSMAIPAGHAVVMGAHDLARTFFYSGLLVLVLTLLVAVALSGFRPANVARSHLLQLAGAYLLVPVALSLPVALALPHLTLAQAVFEMVSCLTGTGATLLDGASTALSMHLWRALVGWMGGFLTMLAAISILAPMNLGGFEVLTGQGAGRGAGGRLTGPKHGQQSVQITRIADPSSRMKRYAGQILPVYAGLTAALWLGLVLVGEPAAQGLIHAMSTLSASGITALATGQPTASGRMGEVLVLICLVFALSRRALPGSHARTTGPRLDRDPELRTALVVILCFTAGLAAPRLMATPDLASAGGILWGSLFTTASFLTTTGFVSADWAGTAPGQAPPGFALLVLAMIGGGVATTAGGLRLIRLYVLYSHARHELERLVHPHSVGSSGRVARSLRQQGASVAWIFTMLFLMSIALVMAALTVMGMGFEPALVLTIAALTGTGPLAGVGAATPILWADQSDAAQIILMLTMVLGRLETLPLIALLAPDSWRD